eukprot:756758-Hanusia_phi.AAC.6
MVFDALGARLGAEPRRAPGGARNQNWSKPFGQMQELRMALTRKQSPLTEHEAVLNHARSSNNACILSAAPPHHCSPRYLHSRRLATLSYNGQKRCCWEVANVTESVPSHVGERVRGGGGGSEEGREEEEEIAELRGYS